MSDFLPMRGYLVCNCCGSNLTGSASKGNGGTYYYYHCQPGCKERFKTDIAHSSFESWINEIGINEDVARLYLAIMEDIFKTNEGDRYKEIKRLETLLNDKREFQEKLTEKYILNGIEQDTYQRMNEKAKMEIGKLKFDIRELQDADSGFDEYSRFGISFLSNLSQYYKDGNTAQKQKILGLIFPEKLIFSNGNYRTNGENDFVNLISMNINKLEAVKTKKTSNNESLSLVVARRGIEPLLPE